LNEAPPAQADIIESYLILPNPDKPELNIDDLRLKICGIALRGVGVKPLRAGGFALSFLLKLIAFLSEPEAKIFNLAMV
jgi:hypothetical protein